jgi:hypothetical protein
VSLFLVILTIIYDYGKCSLLNEYFAEQSHLDDTKIFDDYGKCSLLNEYFAEQSHLDDTGVEIPPITLHLKI